MYRHCRLYKQKCAHAMQGDVSASSIHSLSQTHTLVHTHVHSCQLGHPAIRQGEHSELTFMKDCRASTDHQGFSKPLHSSLATQMLHSNSGMCDWLIFVDGHVESHPAMGDEKKDIEGEGREDYLQMKFKVTSPTSPGLGHYYAPAGSSSGLWSVTNNHLFACS